MKIPVSPFLRRLAHLAATSLAGVAVQLAAATYYVSTTGSDTNSGTISAPFRTIQHGVDVAVNPGDEVYIRGGTYNETLAIRKSGTTAARIVVAGHQSETVIIDGDWQLPADPSSGTRNYTPMVNVVGNYVTLSNLAVTRSRGRGVQVLGDNSLIAGLDVSFSMEAGIIVIGASSVTVENCDVTQVACVNAPNTSEYTGYGIPDVPGDQWRGSGTNWPGALMVVDSTGCIIRGNRVFKVHGEGICDLRSSYSVFEDNLSYDSYKLMFYLDNSQHSTVRRNLIYATADTVFWRGDRYQTTGGPLYPGSTTSPGIAINAEDYLNGQQDPTDIRIYNNFIYNVGSGIGLWGGQYQTAYSDITIAYNTIVNALTGTAGAASEGVQIFAGQATKTGIRFMNNIVRMDTGTLAVGPTTGFTFSHNNWSSAVDSAFSDAVDVIGDSHLALGTGTPDANWFKINGNSPCINQAEAVMGITTDYFGSVRGTYPDIGAHEYRMLDSPTGLTATAVSSSQINLVWTDNSSVETAFEIDRATTAGFTAGFITAVVAANSEAYNSTDLTANMTYYFRVRATSASGNSDYTISGAVTTPAAPPAPGPVIVPKPSSGGGGGAPNLWFLAVLCLLSLVHRRWMLPGSR